jgi:N-acetyl-anhydromuramyl-L-alanine amidase AmpD
MTLTRDAVPSKVEEPEHVFRQAHGANYTPASRTAEDVFCVVLHQTESGGDPFGDANWFANPAAHTSAQCIVGRDGTLVKCMRYRDIAWHAGNWEINQKSVGVELDGFSAHSDTPEAQYRKVAQVVRFLCGYFEIPLQLGYDPEHPHRRVITRAGIIGHQHVPGSDHWDPGAPEHFSIKKVVDLAKEM